MSRDPRYDVLFQPVKIGPVTARNRFYQVPHCNGMGYRHPRSMAAMRGVKAEGGWAVVSTEEVEMHHTSDVSPYVEGRLWDDADIPYHALMCDTVHAHGSLAAIELCHNTLHAANLFTRDVGLGPSDAITEGPHPVQVRAMDKSDIADFRRWHRNAALRAKRAGYDIVYVYAAHDLTIFSHFLSRRHNRRGDEYGGSLENRVRLFREVIEDTKDAVGDTCGVAVRFAVEELLGDDGITAQGEGHDVVAMLAELPDLWDVNVSDWHNDSVTARFGEEGAQEPYIAFVKKLTTKPVVGVGRYTSPDAMVRVISRGIMDMIGAARPSIADPFLPRKIEEGRIEDIRECIGCNICVSGDFTIVPMRCTQNPTMGEEWRKGWHPERIAIVTAREKVLVVGGGPAGLEAARALGARGHEVTLAEARNELGGRVSLESRLPGLSSWGRVRDWRLGQITKLSNVETYKASHLNADDVLAYGCSHVVLATGSHWRSDGIGRTHHAPVAGLAGGAVATADQLMLGDLRPENLADGPIIVFDDDHYYMASVLTEMLVKAGRTVVYVTPAAEAAKWTHNTMEQERIQTRLMELGVTIRPHRRLVELGGGQLTIACTFTGKAEAIACGTLVPITSRLPEEALYRELQSRQAEWADAGVGSVAAIGDALAPGTIAAAIYAGHRYARELGEIIDRDAVPFKREMVELGD
jgi:dimethylamine/trimethylamine dehydrogenase